MLIKIPIHPLTVNQAWCGRRFKSPAYKQYEQDCFKLIRGTKVRGEVQIHYKFYTPFASTTDIDNLIKPIQDILVKCELIEDDKRIMRIVAEKFKGDDKIEIEILKYEPPRL